MAERAHQRGMGDVAPGHEGYAPWAAAGRTTGSDVDDPVTSTDWSQHAAVRRGLTAAVPASRLRSVIWTRALRLANRFRVIRTIDVAVNCFPERGFKAALTAAQRATRGLVKADLLKRYRTDRFQTVYGLTRHGAAWLHELDLEAAASVRRVSDMSNPEHRLWSQFLVLAAEARGLVAATEGEMMQRLAQTVPNGKRPPEGLLAVASASGSGARRKSLRPDALVTENHVAPSFSV